MFLYGLWPAALAIWAARGLSMRPPPESARWSNGALTVPGLPPLGLAELASQAHAERVGHRRHRARLQPVALGEKPISRSRVVRRGLPLDGLSLRYGDRAYTVLDRRNVFYPPPHSIDAMVSTYTMTAALAELVVDAGDR